MFRFYKLYSLYMNNMVSGVTWPREWCLCEKLPRAVLHIPVNRHLLCQVCGLARRPEAGLGSASDEDADQGAEHQTNIHEQRHVEEPRKGQVTRVKVAIRGKKPKAKHSCRTNCLKCGGLARAEAGHETIEAPKVVRSKLCPGLHGLYSKPKGMPRRQQVPQAPPPSTPSSSPTPSSPPSPPAPPRPPRLASESPRSEMPSLVAMAHTVFNPKNNLLHNYSNLFVSNFIPLQSPITDTFGGAISKRSRNSTRPPRSHRSRPLPPLSKVLTNILSSQNSTEGRELGGGLSSSTDPKDSKATDYKLASQFCPFEQYEGPSEDALVGNSARYILHRPKSLHIEPRQDLPNNRIESLNFKWSSASSAKDVPNPMADNLSGILFMTHSVRKTSPLNSLPSDPAVLEQATPEYKPEESEKPERSSILAFIMDEVFCSHGNGEGDKIPELEEINKTISDMFIEDSETVSLKSDVSNEQTVFSSNKTNHYEDYSQPVSSTLSSSIWARCDKKDDSAKSKPSLYKCARCGQHKQREDMVTKIKTEYSRIPRNPDASINTDTNEIRLHKKTGIATKQRLNSVRSLSLVQEFIKVKDEKEKSPKMADQGLIPEIYRENPRIPRPRAPEEIPNGSIIQEQPLNTKIQRKGQRICHQNFKMHRTLKYRKLQEKEYKMDTIPNQTPLSVNPSPPIINDQPSKTLSKIIPPQVPANNIRLCRHKEPSTNIGVIQTFDTVSHQCQEIPKIQVATFVRELVDIGQTMHCYIKEDIPPDYPPSLFEFRLPDISATELLSYRNLGESSDDKSGSGTPIPHTASPKKLPSEGIQKPKIHKNTSLPVSPDHPLKYESRAIQYEELELSFTTRQTDSFSQSNDKALEYETQMVHKKKIHTSTYYAPHISEADIICGMRAEEDRMTQPIKLIDANLSYLGDSNMSHSKWHTSHDLESLAKEKFPLKESNPKTETFPRSKENKENSKEPLYQEKLLAVQKYNSSKLSNEIRKQIDKSLQLKIKKIMNKPIKLLRSTDSDSVEKFVEPFTNKLGVFEQLNQSSSQENLILRPGKNIDSYLRKESELEETASSSSSQEINSSKKPLRLLANPYSPRDSELKGVTLESKIETDSNAASGPRINCGTTEYKGLPPLNWQVVSMGSANPNNTVKDASESSLEEEYYCPIYMCRCLIKSNTFASHFKRDHRGRKNESALSQEYCHKVVEGLPRQFSFDGDFLTKGNTFVALLFYNSLTKERSIPLRNHPLALLAAPQMMKDDPLAGVLFWLVGCNSCAKLLAKLTVYDPVDRIGRSRIIRPRVLSQNQDPREFANNCKDYLLIAVPHNERTFQISVVIDESQT
ncbi:uncharacterized protein LOC6542710 [Drosophila erecta]|uniref:Uncharacterized protein n=1 Tax=Drosophila erecta TaxID=7220 RepID=B3N913_DROER|nr:uncharacterized protein LOC6542710 [Drosophila erecta]EDV58448.2 uncharacterized protein Dere_GG23984 [Drosophila erecta]